MNSKEIIERTITFKHPDRLALDYVLGKTCITDICGVYIDSPHRITHRRIEGNLELWEDEWHNTWARIKTDTTTKGEIHRGAIEDWRQLSSYRLPDLGAVELYKPVKEQFAAAPDKYKLGVLPGFCFSLARKLRRLDNFLMDVKLEIDNVLELMGRIETLLEQMIRQYAQAGADGIFYCEDWGTQDRLLMSPADWCRYFKPSFHRLCDYCRTQNLTVWMHSCGYIYDIIPYLIEAGICVLQLDQPELMGMEKLGREFGGKVTFWSPCDVQKVLPTGDRKLIEQSVRRMVESFVKNGGGLIAKSYGGGPEDLQSIGVKPQWNEFAYECFIKYWNNLAE